MGTGLFLSWGKRGRVVKVATHHRLVRSLRLHGTPPPIPYLPSWPGVLLRTVTNLTSLRVITKFLKLVWNSISICLGVVSIYIALFNLVNKTNMVQIYSILSIFINLYMFQTTIGPSSGETTVFMRHLVLVILCGWLSGTQGGIHSTLHTKCSINRVISTDDGPIVARNM
jgi:hypothetical protein